MTYQEDSVKIVRQNYSGMKLDQLTKQDWAVLALCDAFDQEKAECARLRKLIYEHASAGRGLLTKLRNAI